MPRGTIITHSFMNDLLARVRNPVPFNFFKPIAAVGMS
jgi:hypothetical protein